MYTSYLQKLQVNSLSSCFVYFICFNLFACGERSWRSVVVGGGRWWSVVVVMVVTPVLCVLADVFMICENADTLRRLG